MGATVDVSMGWKTGFFLKAVPDSANGQPALIFWG